MCFSKLFRKKENDMQYTENLELNLPEDTDYIETTSREAINDNFEKLDEISPKRYVIGIYDLTCSQSARVHDAKIYFYNDETYTLKIYADIFNPTNIASGTTIAVGGSIYAWTSIGIFTLPSTCPYSITDCRETYYSYSKPRIPANNSLSATIVETVFTNSSITYIQRPAVIWEPTYSRFNVKTKGAIKAYNLQSSAITLATTEDDYPYITYTASGTYTTE